MAKYSYEFKLKLVKEYLDGQGGYKYISDKYSLKHKEMLHRWVVAYENYGANGLIRVKKKQIYTFDFKLYVVELYLTTDVSYQELSLKVNVNLSTICIWVNDYRNKGPDALKPKRKGHIPKMTKSNSKKSTNENKDSNLEELKRLEDENLKLKIENAYLKELRRLRSEEKPQKKKRE